MTANTSGTPRRAPGTFHADDPRVRVDPAGIGSVSEFAVSTGEVPALAAPPPRRRLRWGPLFWFSALGLLLLGFGVSVHALIVDLFAVSQPLGYAGLTLAAVALLALAAIAAREGLSLARLASVDAIRARAAAALTSDERSEGRAVLHDLLGLTRRIPRLARARAQLQSHRNDIIDGRDLVLLAERELMAPLDAEARRMISSAAKRVSVVTAVSPRAAIDILFVAINAVGLMRRLATLYGARPGALGLLRLFRQVIAHLAVTGGMAVTDSLVQQVVGHGIAARLSARLGEGVLNGLLTARLGLAAMDVTRPLPFSALPRPSLNDLAGSVLRGDGKDGGKDGTKDGTEDGTKHGGRGGGKGAQAAGAAD